MSHIKHFAAGLLATFAMATATADPISVTTLFTPTGGTRLITPTTPYDFVFDITSVYDFAKDTLDGGDIVFSLTDTGTQQEQVRFVFAFALNKENGVQVYTINGQNNVQNGNGNVTKETVSLNSDSIADLTADGLLSIRLGATVGDYNFVNARFNGLVTPPAPAANSGQVPEPLTLGLMAIGLAGAGLARSRKQA